MAQFRIGDEVVYAGERLKTELGGAVGVVHSQVRNCEYELVVDFPSDSYVLNESLLRRHTGFKNEDGGKGKKDKGAKEETKAGPEVQVLRRGRKTEEDID